MIIQIYTTNNAKNVQKVLAAKLELFMEILCDNKSIPKTFLMYVWNLFILAIMRKNTGPFSQLFILTEVLVASSL